MLFFILYSPVLPSLPFSLVLLCTHFLLHTLTQLAPSPAPLFHDLPQSKVYTKSQRCPPPNSDYGIDNSIMLSSSGNATSFCRLSFCFHTMRLFPRIDRTSFVIIKPLMSTLPPSFFSARFFSRASVHRSPSEVLQASL